MHMMEPYKIDKIDINKGWVIYTKSNCSYCSKVKELLDGEKIITIINCDDWLKNSTSKIEFLNHMKNIIGYEYKTFPMVFYSNKFIGGFAETNEFVKKNSETMLEINEDF